MLIRFTKESESSALDPSRSDWMIPTIRSVTAPGAGRVGEPAPASGWVDARASQRSSTIVGATVCAGPRQITVQQYME